jgi:putative PIN family toxin of toxin-antitoxin system
MTLVSRPLPLGEGGGEGSPRPFACKPTQTIILDTNIVLDVFVFNDRAAEPVRQALAKQQLNWLATHAMRGELARVLAYPKIAARLALYNLCVQDVLAKFDQHARLVDAAPKASMTCSDADDQMFIDLAVQQKCLLLSKDRHVLAMRKRLMTQGVQAKDAM